MCSGADGDSFWMCFNLHGAAPAAPVEVVFLAKQAAVKVITVAEGRVGQDNGTRRAGQRIILCASLDQPVAPRDHDDVAVEISRRAISHKSSQA